MNNTENLAKAQAQRELRARGFLVTLTDDGNLEAKKNEKRLRLRVKGLQKKNAVFLKKKELMSVDIVVIYVIDTNLVWVITKKEAQELLDDYQKETIERKGRPPAEEGFNVSQFPEPTGWVRLDVL